ncbi:MAG: sulfatase family protein, partial [Anaerolineae bacterium]
MPPSRDDRVPRRPNIVLIIDDQHNPRVLGHTGECEVQTPHLDRLASQSVVFSNAYCNNPVCAPTRHTLYTGLYASDHGVYVNDLPMREDVTTLMAALNEAGYTTANVGKMHNCPYHHRRDFQYVLHHEFYVDAAGISHYSSFLDYELERRGFERPVRHWSQPREGYASWLRDPEAIAGVNWMPEDLTPEHRITDQSLAFVRDQLAQRPDQPFFLHASYFPPHHPYRPIRKYAELYDPELLTMPPNWDPGQALLGSPGNLSEADVRRFRAFYFGFVTQLDAEIGRLLDGLD